MTGNLNKHLGSTPLSRSFLPKYQNRNRRMGATRHEILVTLSNRFSIIFFRISPLAARTMYLFPEANDVPSAIKEGCWSGD